MGRSLEKQLDDGHIVYDEHGHACWEWRSADGAVHHETDPARIAALLETQATEVTLSSSDVDVARGNRTLDDMRALSERIKQHRDHDGARYPFIVRRVK